MEGVLFLSLPLLIYIAKRYFDALDKGRVASPQQLLAGSKGVEALKQDNKELTERVKNLESIICSLDGELNLRLGKLAEQHNALSRRLVAPPDSPPTVAPAAPLTPPTLAVSIDLAAGTVLAGRYKVLRPLGRGGMGAVYLAHDGTLGEDVALKLISSTLVHDAPTAADRFRREAFAARRITHPSVIRIHDLGVDESGQMYMSMEYFHGRTLAELLSATGPLSVDAFKSVMQQVCDGLGAAHQAGVVHRDLKPGNVLVGEGGVVKLIDFGLARMMFLEGMTATGLILGTPEYMAPEQVRGGSVDARSDVYALGAMAYHAITGRPPFRAETPIAVGFAHCTAQAEPPRGLVPSIPQAWNDVIMKALEKDPLRRPASAAEFRAAL